MSKARVVKSPQARRDLVDVFVQIGRDSTRAANRFLIAADKTFALLARKPGIGSLYETEN